MHVYLLISRSDIPSAPSSCAVFLLTGACFHGPAPQGVSLWTPAARAPETCDYTHRLLRSGGNQKSSRKQRRRGRPRRRNAERGMRQNGFFFTHCQRDCGEKKKKKSFPGSFSLYKLHKLIPLRFPPPLIVFRGACVETSRSCISKVHYQKDYER